MIETEDTSRLFEGADRHVVLWTEQLYREYDHVLFQHGLRLKRPVIVVRDLGARWGLWNGETRTLSLAERLVREYPWSVVVEIMKHEMAHQLVQEQSGNRPLPHGREFQEACRRLGLPAWAASATGAIPHDHDGWRHQRADTEEERLLQKAEKLLALAASDNEHEAVLAMQRVRELYAKHNLDQVRRGDASGMVYALIHLRKKRIENEHSHVGAILGEHFFVRVIFGKLFDATDLCEYAVMELMGTRDNVLMAEYVHAFVLRQAEGLWQDYRRRTGKPQRFRRSYLAGLLTGFEAKLRDESAPVAGEPSRRESRALMEVHDRRLEAYAHERHPKLQTRRSSGPTREADSYTAGHADGRKLSVHRPIGGEGGEPLRLTRK